MEPVTSIIVAAELRYGAAKKGFLRLTRQLEAVLGAIDVLALEAPTDTAYGELRARLEEAGKFDRRKRLAHRCSRAGLRSHSGDRQRARISHGSTVFESKIGCADLGRLR